MFTNKKTRLFENPVKTDSNVHVATQSNNQFLQGAAKTSAKTRSGNNALKYSTTGNDWLDQFGKLGTYLQPRSFDDISRDCATLYADNPLLFVKLTIYMRMIDRKTQIIHANQTTNQAQSGAGLKYESLMRMLWLYQKDEECFWRNLPLFISAGSIKDVFQMLRYDLIYHGWEGRILDWPMFAEVIRTLLSHESTSELTKKYLPTIKSNSKCGSVESQANNIIGKFICSELFGKKEDGHSNTYKTYRRMKSSGTAHEWQQIISKKDYKNLDFSKIHGRALNLLVRSKFLQNSGLSDKYKEWLGDQKTVKYTGYVHELLCELDMKRDSLFEETVCKQFDELVQKSLNQENFTSMIVVRDTSRSMTSTAQGTKYSSFGIAKAMALYFSSFLKGTFSNSWIEFNSTALLHQWKGSTVVEKWRADTSRVVGSTNFQSVIDLFVKLKRSGVPESDFPSAILCISDGEFNKTDLDQTNVETSLLKLRQAGFSDDYVDNFGIILWNIPNSFYGTSEPKFETFGHHKGVFYMSGYSASTIKFILSGEIETAGDLFSEAMNQELLNMVS